MAGSSLALIAGALLLPWTSMAAVPAEAQTQATVTICEQTGSPSNPWVFTTIDARDLSEHLARGDFVANSIADCPAPTATSAPAAPPAPTATPPPTLNPVGSPTSAPTQPTAPAAITVIVTPSPSPTIATAGAQATPAPDVSRLPRSGGEPDRPGLVLMLLAVGAAGFTLRGLSRPRA
jgi:hypothetical protein